KHPSTHATQRDLVLDNQLGCASAYDEDIRIHIQVPSPTPWPPARASRRSARWSAIARGRRRIPPPQGATCGSGETGGTRGNPRRRPAARRGRGRSGALSGAATDPALQRDRPDRESGAAAVAQRVATHPVRDRPAATTRAAG